MKLGNKLIVFQITVCETVVTKIYTFKKIQGSQLFYLSFLTMHVGGIYFRNHKTKNYFPEGAGLLNLSVNTLKNYKSHDSQLFSGDTHYIRENYYRKHPTDTRCPGDVPWRSPNGSNIRDLQVTFRGLWEDQYKNWWFYEKVVFQK